MSRFIKLMDSPETKELMKDHHSFVLFSQIALRARREPGIVFNGNVQTQLEAGQALIGDYESIGLTRQQYRTSIKRLLDNHLITIKTTNRGSIATLINTSIYDINLQDDNHQNNQDLTNKQPSANHQLTTNKNVKKEKKRKEKNKAFLPLSELLKTKIQEQGTDALFKESDLDNWSNDFRLMVEQDKRTPDQIREKIEAVFKDDFWKYQIRSSGTLREKWNSGKLDNLKANKPEQNNESVPSYLTTRL